MSSTVDRCRSTPCTELRQSRDFAAVACGAAVTAGRARNRTRGSRRERRMEKVFAEKCRTPPASSDPTRQPIAPAIRCERTEGDKRMRTADEDAFRDFVVGRSPSYLRVAYLLTGDWG